MKPLAITRALNRDLKPLRFADPVTHVYNPLTYALATHRQYLDKYAGLNPEVMLLGMNPGPWGMAQTGVPFGEVGIVRDWLGIDAKVGKPDNEHPRRPITGLACTRSEVSGARLWGWAREQFKSPERFFARFFVANYCPLSFMEEGGRNRTPDKLPTEERQALFDVCDKALVRLVEHVGPRWVVGIGAFAEARIRSALPADGPQIGRILHPSPASPVANRGWAKQAMAQLEGMGISAAAD